ncbi:MAG TPA: hypothetical protein PLY87_28525, partial [Planctomycetaceae bacterium]|nr:hypothetical protein [Planctomycetaceae bacterium]
ANKLRLSFGVTFLPRWRFGSVFLLVVSLVVTTVSQKCATSKPLARVKRTQFRDTTEAAMITG